MEILNKQQLEYYLACISDDCNNFHKYEVIVPICYYNGDKIGEIKQEFNIETGVLDIYFTPYKAVEFIEINFTITPDGVEL